MKIQFYFKIVFYIANSILYLLYLFPGSLLGWFLYDNHLKQPQITSDFLLSSNHVYAFILLSILGIISYQINHYRFLFLYLFFLSIILEVCHLVIPNRGFEFSDLFGNIVGVLIIFFFANLVMMIKKK